MALTIMIIMTKLKILKQIKNLIYYYYVAMILATMVQGFLVGCADKKSKSSKSMVISAHVFNAAFNRFKGSSFPLPNAVHLSTRQN